MPPFSLLLPLFTPYASPLISAITPPYFHAFADAPCAMSARCACAIAQRHARIIRQMRRGAADARCRRVLRRAHFSPPAMLPLPTLMMPLPSARCCLLIRRRRFRHLPLSSDADCRIFFQPFADMPPLFHAYAIIATFRLILRRAIDAILFSDDAFRCHRCRQMPPFHARRRR
jgi:hypothetical protein